MRNFFSSLRHPVYPISKSLYVRGIVKETPCTFYAADITMCTKCSTEFNLKYLEKTI